MTTVVLVQQGGTGANNAAEARAALSVPSSSDVVLKTGDTMTGNLIMSGATINTNVAHISTIDTSNTLTIKTSSGSNANVIIAANGGAALSVNVDTFNRQYIGFGNTNPQETGFDFVFGNKDFSRWNYSSIVQQAGTESQYYQYHNIGYSVLYNSYGDIGFNAYLNGEGKSLNTDIFYFKGYNDTANAYLSFFNNKLYIAGNGSIGVGNTNPQSKLTVAGRIESTTGGFKFPDGTTQTTAAASVTGIPTLNVVNTTTTTAVAGYHYVLANTSTTTLTLPASPSVADIVWITVGNGRVDNIVGRNGSKINSLEEDLTIDIANVAIQLRYVDSTRGWLFT